MSYRIVTIEDDLLIAQDLGQKLKSLGYEVLGNATNSKEAIDLVNIHRPDILIADILIEGDKDGITTVEEIYKTYRCPVIYLTANSENTMVKKALTTRPSAFLIKPFKISEFAINIDLAIERFREQTTHETANRRVSDSIFLPHDFLYHRIRKKDIFYVEADGAYVKVFTKDRKYQLTVNLKSFERQLNDKSFLRISRKHLINTQCIARINGNVLYLALPDKEQMLSIGRDQRQEILSRFLILKTKD